jgi:hypothetical protein
MSRNMVNSFGRFARANYDLAAKNIPSHPLKHGTLHRWHAIFLEKLEERRRNLIDNDEIIDGLIEWSNKFVSTLKHVSFDKLKRRINACAKEVVEMVERMKPKTVVLNIPSSIDKSATWISILAWPYIQRIVTHVYSYNDLCGLEKDPDRWIITCDDCAYSGIQYGEYMPLGNHRNICLVPYISHYAATGWDGLETEMVLLNSSKIFKSVPEPSATDSDPIPFWEMFFHSDRDSVSSRHAIYFDHKLADNISIYTQIIAYGPVPPGDSNNIEDATLLGGFISGCDFDMIIFDEVGITNKKLLWETDASNLSKHTCPFPIYKRIRYVDPDTKKKLATKNLLYYLSTTKVDARIV